MRKAGSIAAIALMMLLGACSSIDCSMNSKTTCAWSVKYADGDTLFPKRFISFSIHNGAKDTDTTLINRKTNAGVLNMPMSLSNEVDTLYMTVESAQGMVGSDEILVRKSNIPVFESVDCDPRFSHKIHEVTSSGRFIDSIVVVNSKVSNTPVNENIRIYLHNAQ